MGVDQTGHLALYKDLAKTKLMALLDDIISLLVHFGNPPCWNLLAFFLGTSRPVRFGFTSLKSHQLPESKSARARVDCRNADHQGPFRLRSPHGHVIPSYQPRAITFMTQARLYTLAKHR
jgi:hypothetical protein